MQNTSLLSEALSHLSEDCSCKPIVVLVGSLNGLIHVCHFLDWLHWTKDLFSKKFRIKGDPGEARWKNWGGEECILWTCSKGTLLAAELFSPLKASEPALPADLHIILDISKDCWLDKESLITMPWPSSKQLCPFLAINILVRYRFTMGHTMDIWCC